ncbi:hypothetical protein GCM10022254_23450 [Actinomadura meridiana]|uniref:Uncharacterized protein n=1 Tax=Actinomadura meridiana TaxID=559626 RepID=A0ABP8BXS6_9ACTN
MNGPVFGQANDAIGVEELDRIECRRSPPAATSPFHHDRYSGAVSSDVRQSEGIRIRSHGRGEPDDDQARPTVMIGVFTVDHTRITGSSIE